MKKVNLVDCGQASRKTKGTWFGFVLEIGAPPNNKLFIM